MKSIPLILCLCLSVHIFAVQSRGSDNSRPDIFVYLADDHGMLDCSVYGSEDVSTPNLEKLAAAGIKFNRAFIASPACAPSRAALLTGLMPARNGAEANHTFAPVTIKRLPDYLHELGYEVAAFGKVYHGNDPAMKKLDASKRSFSCTNLKRDVTQFLTQRTSKKPLALLVGTTNPHVPWAEVYSFDPQKVHLPPYFIDTLETREHRAMYYQEIKELDELLADLQQLVADYMRPNRVTLYSSDHGAQWPFGKWNLYDAGIRTPLLVSWPGVISPGVETDAMVSWVDILPTLIELAGGTAPADIDGRSFAHVLRNPAEPHRKAIFTTHSGDGNKNIYPIRSIRTEQYKYIWNLHPEWAHTNHSDLLVKPRAGEYWLSWAQKAKTDPRARAIIQKYHQRPAEELFDITQDPFEQHNLADDPAFKPVKTKLRARLEKWMTRQGDKKTVYSTPRPLDQPETYAIGSEAEN